MCSHPCTFEQLNMFRLSLHWIIRALLRAFHQNYKISHFSYRLVSKRFQSKKCFVIIFSLFSCVRTSVIVKKIIKSTFILVKRAWIQHWKKVTKKVKTPNALKICFLLRYFSWKPFFLETGIERNQVKNENCGWVFWVFFLKNRNVL